METDFPNFFLFIFHMLDFFQLGKISKTKKNFKQRDHSRSGSVVQPLRRPDDVALQPCRQPALLLRQQKAAQCERED